ncbi:ANTAR domain-containing protein [Mycobacterium sp. SMC-4]|uniref:ANTAR domain-containing protein n=1 Tax=Mycobacterium sp. SMC-4 TaxID=2857059 RepID=UPI003D074519
MSFSGTDHTSRQVIDVAVGILVGLRGCSRRAAFDELVAVVHQTGIGLGTVASGLVAVASNSASADHAEAFSIWGDLIQRRTAVGAV